MATGNMQIKFDKSWMCGLWDMHEDRQIHIYRQACHIRHNIGSITLLIEGLRGKER